MRSWRIGSATVAADEGAELVEGERQQGTNMHRQENLSVGKLVGMIL